MTAAFPNRLTISLPQSERDHLDGIAKHSGLAVGTVARILLTRAIGQVQEDDITFVHMLRFAETHGPAIEASEAQAVPLSSAPKIAATRASKPSGAGPGRAKRPSQTKAGARGRTKGAK